MATRQTRPDIDGEESAPDLNEWLKLASDSGVSMLRLFKAELMLTLAQLPLLGVLWIVMVPLLLFAWMGFSVTVAWLFFAYTGEVLAGLLSFFFLQLLCIAGVALKISNLRSGLLFPASRRQLRNIASGMEK